MIQVDGYMLRVHSVMLRTYSKVLDDMICRGFLLDFTEGARRERRRRGEGVQGTDEYIAGLIKNLHLVVAERYVGNVEATVPVIQQILKDLKG